MHTAKRSGKHPTMMKDGGLQRFCREVSFAGLLGLAVAYANPAGAIGPVRLELEDITYEQVKCASGTLGMTFRVPACIKVTATTNNPRKDTFYNADVFGRIFDRYGQNALDRDEASDAGRVAAIKVVEPGMNKVSFQVVVSDVQLRESPDLRFEGFKIVAYPGGINAPLETGWLGDEIDVDCEFGLCIDDLDDV